MLTLSIYIRILLQSIRYDVYTRKRVTNAWWSNPSKTSYNKNMCMCYEIYRNSVCMYRQTFKIRRSLVGNKLVDHSDAVGASPFGAAPTTSWFLAQHLASMDWAKATAKRDEKHWSFLVFGAIYTRGFTIGCIIVRRAGLMRLQQDFEWWWSVPLSSASLY